MTTEKSFLNAICETPDDDAPRLVFADWLDDNCQPERAEFIRLQCRLAKMDEWSEGRDELVRRERELLIANEKKWKRATSKFTARAEFRRGFVEEMSLPVAKFLDCADAIFAATPLLALRPLQVRPRWDDFVASPHLARLRVLDLHCSALGVGRTQALAECLHLTNLHELNLGMNHARRGAVAILRSPHLGNLRKLRLNKNEGGDEMAEALAHAGRLPHLRALDLEGNAITREGRAGLARCGWMRQLESLDLSTNPFGDAGLEALAASEVWANKRLLNLIGCDLTGAAGRILAGCTHLEAVRTLALSTVRNESVLGELAKSPHLRSLRALDLSGNHGLPEVDAEALAWSPLAVNLTSLRLRGLQEGTQKTLLAAKSLAGLTTLEMGGTRWRAGTKGGNVGAWVREATHLENLTRLDVSDSMIGDPGAAALADSPHLARLEYLDVGGNSLTQPGFEALARSPYLNSLRRLVLGWTHRVPADARKALEERFGPLG